MSQTLKEQLVYLQGVCKRSLKFVCRDVLGMGDWSAVHNDVEAFLKAPGQFKLLQLPRGHLKSSIVTKGWSIQQALINPDIRILLANNTWDNSRKFLRSIQKYLEPGGALSQVFGNFVSAHWNQDECTIRMRKKILDAPTWATTGLEKEQTSQHYDLIIGDDLVARENVGTPEQREKVKLYIKDLYDLLEPNGQMVFIGTRWHQSDAYADLLEDPGFQSMIRTAYTDQTHSQVLFPQKFTLEKLRDLRVKKGAYEFCTPAETPILMGDWKTRPIEHVKVGDEVIGFTLGHGTHTHSKLVRARVKRTFSMQGHVLRYEMKSGRTVLSTQNHKWYTGRNDAGHPAYAPAKIGSRLQFVCDVDDKLWNEQERMDWSYLAGLFDGEGSTKSGGALTLTQCQSVNPDVHKAIGNVLDRLKISYGSSSKDRYSTSRNMSPGNTNFWLHDSFNVGLNLIRYSGCAKAGQIADRFLKHGTRFVREEDEVIDVKYDSLRTVYALETETGNYVAWGYASSNSAQYLNNPISEDAADFKAEWIKHYDPTTPHPGSLYLTVDPAISLSREADYSALVVAGMFSNRMVRVVDRVHRRMVPSDLVDAIFELVKKWRIHRVGIETFAFQKTLKYDIQRQQRERGIFFSIDELGKRHSGRGEQVLSKEARIRRLQPYFEQGLVEVRADLQDLEAELLAFPRGKHDDLIDALSYQLDYLVPSSEKSVASKEPVHGSVDWWLKYHMPQPKQTIYERFFADLKGPQ